MLPHPATKYRAFPPIDLPDRQWPSRTITRPPVWMSTDLRDGNQSLFEPMNGERKMRMFMPNCYVTVDFQNRVLARYSKGEKEMFPGVPEIIGEESTFENGDALMEEIKHFLDCIRQGREPLCSGKAGRRALATAIEITSLLKA